MNTKTVSYAELARLVGDAVLFNNHNEGNDEWYYGMYKQPLLEKKLDELEEESKQYALERIKETTDADEKAELQEEYETDLENGEFYADLLDFDIYQTYHITANGAEYLFNHTSELISYDEKLDAYLWHISHYGTSWSGVHTTLHEFEDGDYDDFVPLSEMDKYMNY